MPKVCAFADHARRADEARLLTETALKLKDAKVGDTVYVVNYDGLEAKPRKCEVTKVGRKFLVAGGQEFVRDTGEWNSIGFASHKHAYTEAEWERVCLEREFCRAVRSFENQISRKKAIASLSDAVLKAETQRLRDWSAELEAKR